MKHTNKLCRQNATSGMSNQVIDIEPLGYSGHSNYADPGEDCRPVTESTQYTELDRRHFVLFLKYSDVQME
jgi:hypothetical protein